MRNLKNSELWGQKLIAQIRSKFKTVNGNNPFVKPRTITLVDCLMSCFSIFSLKWPSLMKYQENIRQDTLVKNLKTLYGINNPPSDTYLRERLDDINPDEIAPAYKKIFSTLQRNKVLEKYQYLEGSYLISIDGTGQFSSEKVHCNNCCVKNHKDGRVTYYHQLLGAVLVHPDEKAVIPLCPEMIKKEDGANKNDCERNASKRLLARLRREHPHLKITVIEDGLASNGPHIKELERHKMNYILGAKKGDHPFLFDWVREAEIEEYEYQDKNGKNCHYKFVNGVPLNDAHFDLKVNFLDYTETLANGKKTRFTWVTNFTLNKANVSKIMKGGRARWKIENETFNTLKNQGYEFEHNYGHGKKNLCSIMSMMMMLSFLVDQAQLLCCRLYQKAKQERGGFKTLWEYMRIIMDLLNLDSWDQFYRYLSRELRVDTS